MSQITISSLAGYTEPLTISVFKRTEGYDRFRSRNGTSIVYEAATDGVAATYDIRITDANGCFHTESFTQTCGSQTVYIPTYSFEVVQPRCNEFGLTPGYVRLYNINNATRYKICDSTAVFNCTNCESSDGEIVAGADKTIYIFPPNPGSSKTTTIRVYNGPGCETYLDFNFSHTSPVCGGNKPSLKSSVLQPYCDGDNNIVNATMKLTEISSATRYKVCYDTLVFNCSDCFLSTGAIPGNQIDITLDSPAAGLNRNGVVRVFNGNACDDFTDVIFQLSSPICNSNQITMAVLDYRMNSETSGSCENPSTDFNMYVTPNTPGVAENGQRSQVRGGVLRNLPNGGIVPDVLISAALKLACAPGPFYRWAFNLSLFKAKYPGINVFTFDIFAERINGTSTYLAPQTNTFSGVRMVYQVYGDNPTDSNDAFRDPRYDGVFTTRPVHTYNTTITGFRKIGTMSFNVSTNAVTFTNG